MNKPKNLNIPTAEVSSEQQEEAPKAATWADVIRGSVI